METQVSHKMTSRSVKNNDLGQPRSTGLPAKQGLYDPQNEHDACGVGFVVNVKGRKSHAIVRDALTILINLRHRGACGCENNTGDGAGILVQMPHRFLQQACEESRIELPAEKQYGCGLVFLPPVLEHRRQCEAHFERIVREEGQKFLGWRNVPTNNGTLGATAKAGEPVIRMAFIGRDPRIQDDLTFERKLFVIRRRAENAIRYANDEYGNWFYVPSLSSRTLVYKGMLMAEQVGVYFPELDDPSMQSALAITPGCRIRRPCEGAMRWMSRRQNCPCWATSSSRYLWSDRACAGTTSKYGIVRSSGRFTEHSSKDLSWMRFMDERL